MSAPRVVLGFVLCLGGLGACSSSSGGGGADLSAMTAPDGAGGVVPDMAIANPDLTVVVDLTGTADQSPLPDLAPPPPTAEILIPTGTFLMGTNSSDPLVGLSDQKPAFMISVPAFFLDQREATVADYTRCVTAGKCGSPAYTEARCNLGVQGKLDHPMNCLNQIEAASYCTYMGKRLPKEEELELAMRGTQAAEYAWGSVAPDAQLCWKKADTTCPSGTYPTTLLGSRLANGFADLAGNVSEWTSSQYTKYPDRMTAIVGGQYVLRGGSWGSQLAEQVRGAYRLPMSPTMANPGTGVRCARTM